jgi:hypothetical protein
MAASIKGIICKALPETIQSKDATTGERLRLVGCYGRFGPQPPRARLAAEHPRKKVNRMSGSASTV